MNQHWEPGGTTRGRVVLLHGMRSTAATWWRVGPALAAGIEADDLLVRSDRQRLVRRKREANPTWADADVEHSVDGLAAADTAVRAQLPPDRFVVLDGGHRLHRDLPARWLEVVGGFADTVLAGADAPGQPGPGGGSSRG